MKFHKIILTVIGHMLSHYFAKAVTFVTQMFVTSAMLIVTATQIFSIRAK